MKFDADGKRIPSLKLATPDREPAYWFEQSRVDEYGFCDEPIPCESSASITHLCSRFDGHGGQHAALHKGESGGRKVRRLEYS